MERSFKYWLNCSIRASVLALFSAGLLAGAARDARADIFDGLDTALETIATGFDFIWPEYLDRKDFNARLGLGIGLTPDYLGSDNYRFRVIPLIDIRYKDLIAVQGSKIRFNFLRQKNFRAGPLMNILFGRDEDRNRILTGLGSISDTIQLGGFVEGNFPSGFIFSADVRKATGAGQGITARLIVAQGIFRSDKSLLALAGRLEWGSGKHNQTNFGITAAQAANSVLPEFDAGAGLNSLGINLVTRRVISEKWRLEGIVGYSHMLGDADDSPLVAGAGSSHQVLAGVGLRYSF